MHLDYRYIYADWKHRESRAVVVAPVGTLGLSRDSGNIPPGNGHQFQVIEIPDSKCIRLHVYSADLDKPHREWKCREQRTIPRGPGWAARSGIWGEAESDAISKIERSKDDLRRLELYACALKFYQNDRVANSLLLQYIRTRWDAKFGDFDRAAETALPCYRQRYKSLTDMLTHLRTARLDDEILDLMREVARTQRV